MVCGCEYMNETPKGGQSCAFATEERGHRILYPRRFFSCLAGRKAEGRGESFRSSDPASKTLHCDARVGGSSRRVVGLGGGEGQELHPFTDGSLYVRSTYKRTGLLAGS